MTIIERVARLWLLEPTGRLEDNFPLNMRFDNLDQFLNCIRAAIEAMREPTEAMYVAGGTAEGEAPDLWRAMIDEALKTTP